MKRLTRLTILLLILLAGGFVTACMLKGKLVSAEAGKVVASFDRGYVSLTYEDFASVELGDGVIEVWKDDSPVAKLVNGKTGKAWNTLFFELSGKISPGNYRLVVPSGAVRGTRPGSNDYADIDGVEIELVVTPESEWTPDLPDANGEDSIDADAEIVVDSLTRSYDYSFTNTSAQRAFEGGSSDGKSEPEKVYSLNHTFTDYQDDSVLDEVYLEKEFELPGYDVYTDDGYDTYLSYLTGEEGQDIMVYDEESIMATSGEDTFLNIWELARTSDNLTDEELAMLYGGGPNPMEITGDGFLSLAQFDLALSSPDLKLPDEYFDIPEDIEVHLPETDPSFALNHTVVTQSSDVTNDSSYRYTDESLVLPEVTILETEGERQLIQQSVSDVVALSENLSGNPLSEIDSKAELPVDQEFTLEEVVVNHANLTDNHMFADSLWGDVSQVEVDLFEYPDSAMTEDETIAFSAEVVVGDDTHIKSSNSMVYDVDLEITKRDWSFVGSLDGDPIGTISINVPNYDHYRLSVVPLDDFGSVVELNTQISSSGEIICLSPTSEGFILSPRCRYLLSVDVFDVADSDSAPVVSKTYPLNSKYSITKSSLEDLENSVAISFE